MLGASLDTPKRTEIIPTLVTIFIYEERLTLKTSSTIKYFGVIKEVENLGSPY